MKLVTPMQMMSLPRNFSFEDRKEKSLGNAQWRTSDFVIFFTRTKFLKNKTYTEKRHFLR